MTKPRTFAVSYFLGRAFFLGFGFSLLFKLLDKDAWIASFLGIFLGCGILWLFERLKEKHPLSNAFQKFIFFIFNFFVFNQILFIFETFCSSFYLIKSPSIYILAPLFFIILRITKNGFQTISRVSDVLFPIEIALLFVVSLGLLRNINLEYFKPIMDTKPSTLFQGAIYFACYSTAPYFLLWNEKTEKNILKPYLVSALSIFSAALFITAVLGPNLAQIYRYPEYMTLKKLKLFNFIEKVENIVSIAWLFDLFITLSVSGNNIKQMLPKKYRTYTFSVVLIILFGVSLYGGTHYQGELWIYTYLPILLGGFMLLLIFVSFFSRKKEPTKLS